MSAPAYLVPNQQLRNLRRKTGGEPSPSEVRYVDLAGVDHPIKDRILAAMQRVLEHGKFVLGPELDAFEARFAEYCGVRYAVGVGNGTSALFLTLRALGIGAGEERRVVLTHAHDGQAGQEAGQEAGGQEVDHQPHHHRYIRRCRVFR